MRDDRSGRPSVAVGSDGGFALAIVVFLLFTVGVSAVTAYQIILAEERLSSLMSDSRRAQSIAEAGLMRYIGAAVRGEPDPAVYFIDNGEAQVSARKIQAIDDWTDLYRVTSVGRVTDPRFFEAPAIREVSSYAILSSKALMDVPAAFVTTASSVTVTRFNVVGSDGAPVGSCPSATGTALAGVAAAGATSTGASGSVTGSPNASNLGSAGNVLSTLGLPPWATMSTTFPVDYDLPSGGAGFPNFALLPAEAYPVIRVNGNLSASGTHSGRGTLIVTGTLTINSLTTFSWQGVILAGGLTSSTALLNIQAPDIDGTLVAGLSGAPASVTLRGPSTFLGSDIGNLRYHACHVESALREMGILNPVDGTWWSGY